MKKRSALLGLTLTLFGAAAALATDGTPTPGVTPTVPTPTLGNLAVPKPQILESKDKISDSTNYYLPPPPRVGADGNDLALVLDRDDFPLDLSALGLDDPANLSQLPALLKADTDGNKYYWHSLPKGIFWHRRDGGRDWLGWVSGSSFHWVLWRGERFWWHHEYAERWVHWDQGYWRWQGELKGKPLFQVVLKDGHYHACDSTGVLGEDLMQTGKEEVVTEPVEKPNPTRGPDDLGPSPKTGHGLSDI